MRAYNKKRKPKHTTKVKYKIWWWKKWPSGERHGNRKADVKYRICKKFTFCPSWIIQKSVDRYYVKIKTYDILD